MLWAVVSVGSVALGTSFVDHFREERLQSALARAQVAAEALEQTLLRSVEAIESTHALVQTRETLLQHGDKSGATAIGDYLRSLANQEQFGVLQVATIGADGWMTWGTIPYDAPIWLGDRDHFKIHKNGLTSLSISKPLIGRASKRWSVQFTRPLWAPDGSFAGVSVISFDPMKLSAALGALNFGEGSKSAVVSMQGYLIARSEDAEAQLGRPPNPDQPVLIAARKAPSGTLQYESIVSHRQILAAYRMIGAVPLVVVVGLDAEHELSIVNSVSLSVRIAEIAAILTAAALLGILAQRQARQRTQRDLEIVRMHADASERARGHITRLMSGVPAAIYGMTVYTDGTVERFEMAETAYRLTGWTAEDLAAWEDWGSKVHIGDKVAWSTYLSRVTQNGEAAIEYRFTCKDGRVLWLRDQARLVEWRGSDQMFIVGYISDITREKALQSQTIAASKLATLGEMATGLAHELNQPIAIMSLAAENATRMLQMKGADGIDFAVQRMARVVDQASRARTIINHLRIFGRQGEEDLGPIDLKHVVEASCTLVVAAMRQAGIDVVVKLPDDPTFVLGQTVLAEHVVVNLLLNARDATEQLPSDRLRQITISADADAEPGAVTLFIDDSGPGIPPEILDRVFEPFFTTKEVGKGTGLGLSLCHGIVCSFGGTITASNRDGGGARLAVTFKRAPQPGTDPQQKAEPNELLANA